MTLNKRIDVLIDERERQCCELLSFSLSLTSFTQQALDFIGDAVDSLDEENYV